MVDASVKLAKGGQRSRSHPHDEVFILVAVVARIGAQTRHVALPVLRLDRVVPIGRILELDVLVRVPRDSRVKQRHSHRRARVRRTIVAHSERI